MTRDTHGVASPSYHSIRSLRDCTNLSEVSTEVQRVILRNFNVDDILTGANSIDEARILQKQLVATHKGGRIDLREWTSNKSSITLDLPPEYCEANDNFGSFLKFPTSKRKTLKQRFCSVTFHRHSTHRVGYHQLPFS